MRIVRNLAATAFSLSAAATFALLGVSPASAGCGGCSYVPPHVIYTPPVEAVFPPPPPPPVHVDFRYRRPHYCGCTYGVARYAAPAPYIVDRPYIVDQGPVYSGPGITTVPTYIPPRRYYQVHSPVRYRHHWRHHHHHHHHAVLRTRG